MNQTHQDFDYHEVIRRRRIAAVALLGLAFVVLLTLNDGELEPFGGMFSDDSGVYAAGDPYGEWIYAECDGEQQQITVLKDGHLLGVAGLDTVQTVTLPDWCDLPRVDNQQLGLWDAKLNRLTQLTDSGDAAASEILAAALDLPLTSVYLQPLGRWLERDANHGAALLDAVALSGSLDTQASDNSRLRRENLSRVLNQAMRQAISAGPSEDQIRFWLRSDTIGNDAGLLSSLWRLGADNPAIATSLLERLDTVAPQDRTQYYRSLSETLGAAPEHALLLARQLENLPSSERVITARLMLDRPGDNSVLARALANSFEDTFYGEQAELEAFRMLADTLRDEDGAAELLTGLLEDLADQERRLAAIHLVQNDHADGRFTLAVLDRFSELHPLSRPRVVRAILQSPGYDDARIQAQLVRAVNDHVEGIEKRELLESMESLSGTSPATRDLIDQVRD